MSRVIDRSIGLRVSPFPVGVVIGCLAGCKRCFGFGNFAARSGASGKLQVFPQTVAKLVVGAFVTYFQAVGIDQTAGIQRDADVAT